MFNFVNVKRQTTRRVILDLNIFFYFSDIMFGSQINEIMFSLDFCHVMKDLILLVLPFFTPAPEEEKKPFKTAH